MDDVITQVEEYLYQASLGRGSYNEGLKLLELLYDKYQKDVNGVVKEEKE